MDLCCVHFSICGLGMEYYLGIFRRALRDSPGLCRHLSTICDRVDQHGALPKQVTLGADLHQHRDLRPLRQLFGDSVRLTASATTRIDLTQLTARMSPEQCESWIAALYAVLERQRLDRPAQRRQRDDATSQVLERWALAFPDLSGFSDVLRGRSTSWQKQVSRQGADAVQGLLFQAGATVRFLIRNRVPIGLAEVAAQGCGDSKALRRPELRSLVGDGLLAMADELPPYTAEQRDEAFRRCGVTENPTAIRVTLSGPLVYCKGGVTLSWIKSLWGIGESATLTWENLDGISDMTVAAGPAVAPRLITCENETPFCRLQRELTHSVVVYTEGYPNTAVKRLLALLEPTLGEAYHWGDSDVDGLRIASVIDGILPVRLWRCNLSTLESRRKDLIPLTPVQCERSQQYLARHPDFRFARELAFTIANGWLEQERWQPVEEEPNFPGDDV